LEPYKEIVNLKEYHFFTGYADLKYGANYNRYRSEKTNNEHFTHRVYYDVEIYSVTALTNEEEFKKWEPNFQLSKIKDNLIVVHLDGKEYSINADVVYLNESFPPDHVQREGDELHGDFQRVPVSFKIHKKSIGFRCIANYPTGKIEFREDGEYHEFTTGAIESDGVTCSTEWRNKTIEIPCPKNQPTGNREENENCYRYEYYSGEKSDLDGKCLTYWGEWICDGKPQCVKNQPTGRKENRGKYFRIQYYTGNLTTDGKACETYWGDWIKKPEPPGCGTIFFLVLVLIWIFQCIKWAYYFGSLHPILLGIGLPLMFVLIGYLFNRSPRFSRIISAIFSWIFNLFYFAILLALLNGLFNLFTTNWGDNTKQKTESQFDEQEVVTVDSTHIPTDNRESSGENKSQKRFKRIHLKWTDFEDNRYRGTFDILIDDLFKSSNNLQKLKYQNFNSYSRIYKEIYQKDKNCLNDLYLMLDSIRETNQQSKNQFAKTIVSMVQSIDYVLILEGSCNDENLIKNRTVQTMLRKGVKCEGFAPFGIKTPIEFLTSFDGDCDTRTLLLYTIFKHYKYDVAIINSDYYAHSMLGLSLEGAIGSYKRLGGKRYYFWETTDKGFVLGELPREISNVNYWNIEIN
jgi:hypothetical protein